MIKMSRELFFSLTEFMPLLDLGINVISNLVNNCIGMGALYTVDSHYLEFQGTH